MAYILGKERSADVEAAFKCYLSYLGDVESVFPASAFKLARSEWYYDPNNHKCPHDAWLESICIDEPFSGERNEIRFVSIRVRLLSAYHDGYLSYIYPKVFNYELNAFGIEHGHCDWQYDEFRLSRNNKLIHEIEWCRDKNIARWIIEAEDVFFEWEPKTINGGTP